MRTIFILCVLLIGCEPVHKQQIQPKPAIETIEIRTTPLYAPEQIPVKPKCCPGGKCS